MNAKRGTAWLVLVMCCLTYGAECEAEDRMFYKTTQEDDTSSKYTLSLVKDLAVKFRPSKVVVDCACLTPDLRVSGTGEWFLDFSVEWKSRLIVPVSFVFYEEGGRPHQTDVVFLVRNFDY